MHWKLTLGFFLLAAVAFAQSDRGAITGTISDPAGAVVSGAAIEVRNMETGAVYQVGSSATGNYVVALPTGTYELSVMAAGFKKYARENLTVPVAQTLRIDVVLEVGAATESITVSEAAPLLKTESGELSHNVSTNTLDNLPVLGIGAGAGVAGIRNPYAVLQVLPGADWRPDRSIRVNGMPSNSESLRLEGQDTTNGIASATQSQTQPSVDAIEEFAIQTSNYAAEFGQAGGGVFNVTMKSGTNQFHGSGYEYFVNEALNAGQPFTDDGNGHLLRPRQRRNDFGFTAGGPVLLPKIYNGHDRTFFFISFEQFRETIITNNSALTVPTPAYRSGNFQQALTGKLLSPNDGLGRPVLENTIYDPASDRLVNGVRYRDPFPNNTIPLAQQDPVALNVLKLVPLPTRPGLTNNFIPTFSNSTVTYIPSIKIDHSISSNLKISGYWSRTGTSTPNNDGLPYPITTAIPSNIVAHTIRVNVDNTLTPTLLLHLGAGLLYTTQDQQTSYDPSNIGFKGANANLFPLISTLPAGGLTGPPPAQGGLVPIGTGSTGLLKYPKPTGTASLTWVHNNHTLKFGGELVVQGFQAALEAYAASWMYFDYTETGLPALNGAGLKGNVGYPFASFLMGRVHSGYIAVPSGVRLGAHALSGYVQDSWKVTRKLTLDYGLRYDFETYMREHDGIMPNMSPSTPNPSAGGLPGGIIFEGYGPGRCNCAFAKNYPFAFGPRLGLAYQITPKTVLRVGAGVSYGRLNSLNGKTNNAGSSNPYGATSYGDPAFLMQDGVPYHVTFPNFDPGQLPLPGTVGNPTNFIDPNAGRPARIVQWSFGLQRELSRNLVVEATYLGNRGVWWQANTMKVVNALTEDRLNSFGLSLNNPDDLKLLASPVNSPLAAARGFGTPPYSSFPTASTVAQALRPFPEYLNPVNTWPPLGSTWYDSLQLKATKRFSYGLDFSSSFTWSKQLVIGSEQDYNYFGFVAPASNNVFNRDVNKYISGFDQPFLFVFSGSYTLPKLQTYKALSWAARDWQIGAVLRYGSGLPIQVPTATTNLATYTFQNTFVNRIPGVPVFTTDINCHCYDPNKTFVLNNNAWENPALGQWGTAAAYYNDYRKQRRPQENLSLARNFRFKEQYNLQIRAEFTNIFNRAIYNDPLSGNAFATQQTRNGQNTAGFGWINTASLPLGYYPRSGTLVARFTF